jgi:hypothetical protein
MLMLPLDDPRWRDLAHRGWSRGRPVDSVSPFVPDELAALDANPADFERFSALWPYLSSEGTTWAAAYAAAPYLIRFARRLPVERRTMYLIVLGLIEADSCPDGENRSFAIEPYLEAGYRHALADARLLVAESLTIPQPLVDLRYLLSAVAALQGQVKLAKVLSDIDCISGPCPACGTEVYPPELQEVVH